MTVVDVVGRVDELADGTGGSVDAVTGAAIGPYQESQLKSYRSFLIGAVNVGIAG